MAKLKEVFVVRECPHVTAEADSAGGAQPHLKLQPDQEKIASQFAGKLQQMAFKEHNFSLEDWKDVVRQIMSASKSK